MTSTIANLDLEELVYAFAAYVAYKVIAAPEPQLHGINLRNFKLELK